MSWFIPLGEFAPVAVPLLVLAIAWTMILLEQRRRRRRAAAGLPIFGPAVRPEGAEGTEGTGPVRQPVALSLEVVEHFRAMGPGWQARIDEVLKRHVREEEDRARRPAAGAAEGAKARVAEERSDYDAGEETAGEGR
jgi:BrnA antitoxin of type II toxin-antitoxin system